MGWPWSWHTGPLRHAVSTHVGDLSQPKSSPNPVMVDLSLASCELCPCPWGTAGSWALPYILTCQKKSSPPSMAIGRRTLNARLTRRCSEAGT